VVGTNGFGTIFTTSGDRNVCGSFLQCAGDDHGLNSTPHPFFSPGITIKGALTVRFSDLTLFGG
jgi:hypothetical protein